MCDACSVAVTIRELEAGEWSLFRDVRIRAVTESPDAFRPTLDELEVMADEEWMDLVRSTVEHPRGLLVIAESDGVPVGGVFGRITEDGATTVIGAMWVDPTVRKQGVGSSLLDKTLAWGRSSGAHLAELWVVADNGPAFRLYRAAGFEPTGATGTLREDSDIPIVQLSLRPTTGLDSPE
jgi:GNAT superfamily N-acetyltransferase